MTEVTRMRLETFLFGQGFEPFNAERVIWKFTPKRRNPKEVCTIFLQPLKWMITELCDNGSLGMGEDLWEATDSLEPYSEESIKEFINIIRAIVADDK